MSPLIHASQLEAILNSNSNIVICDCRFDLTQTSAGRDAYTAGHIPGAIYVDLDKDLSDIKTGTNGRHPLPSPDHWAKKRQHLGIDTQTHVIAYDNQGSVYASRLWWMLRAIGHQKVQILNGGLATWKGAISTVTRVPTPLHHSLKPQQYQGLILVDAVLENISSPNKIVIDARSADRFHGQNETIDPVGGHIPGAINRFFKDNLVLSEFKPAEVIRQEFTDLLGNTQASNVIHQCGSGVTACHNLLAMEIAGLSGSLLYAGSWSEWCSDPQRPIEH